MTTMRRAVRVLPRFTTPGRGSWGRIAAIAVIFVLVAPLMWWTLANIAIGWIPQGDEALIAIRAHDVFSAHPPLLGMRSTSSLTAPGVFAHHPGPMEFYVLAVPYLLTGWHPVGILVGCLATTLAFVAIALHSAYRAASWPGFAVAAAVIGLLEVEFAMALVLPLNAWVPVVGLLAVAMLAWRLLLGQLSAMPWYAVCASYVAQAHIAFAPVVGLLSVVLAVVGMVRWRRRRASFWPLPGFHRKPSVPRWRRRGWVTAGVVILCWLPVLVDLRTGDPSNATELLRIVTAGGGRHVGLLVAVKYVLTLMVPVGPLPPIVRTVVGGGLAALAVVAAVDLLRRWRADRSADVRPMLCLYAVCGPCVVPVVWMGAHVDGGLRLRYVNLLWAVPLLLAAALCWWAADLVAEWVRRREWMRSHEKPRPPRWAPAAIAAAAVVLAAGLGIQPGSYQSTLDYWKNVGTAKTVVSPMITALDAPRLRGRPIVVTWYGTLSWSSIGPALEADLVAHGREVYFDTVWPNPEYDAYRRVRHAPGDAVVAILRERSGPDDAWSLRDPPPSRVAVSQKVNGGRIQLLIATGTAG